MFSQVAPNYGHPVRKSPPKQPSFPSLTPGSQPSHVLLPLPCAPPAIRCTKHTMQGLVHKRSPCHRKHLVGPLSSCQRGFCTVHAHHPPLPVYGLRGCGVWVLAPVPALICWHYISGKVYQWLVAHCAITPPQNVQHPHWVTGGCELKQSRSLMGHSVL